MSFTVGVHTPNESTSAHFWGMDIGHSRLQSAPLVLHHAVSPNLCAGTAEHDTPSNLL